MPIDRIPWDLYDKDGPDSTRLLDSLAPLVLAIVIAGIILSTFFGA